MRTRRRDIVTAVGMAISAVMIVAGVVAISASKAPAPSEAPVTTYAACGSPGLDSGDLCLTVSTDTGTLAGTLDRYDMARAQQRFEQGHALAKAKGCTDAPPVDDNPGVIDGYRHLDGWAVVVGYEDEKPVLADGAHYLLAAWEDYDGRYDWDLTIYGWCAP
jgi:hypothetical protein